MTRRVLVVCLLALAVAGTYSHAVAQKPVTQGAAVTETATIVAIDSTNRLITLKDKDGITDTIVAGPEVKRFSELKVGDNVTFRYYESVVYAIQKPGDKAPAPVAGGLVRSTGPKPGGTLSEQTHCRRHHPGHRCEGPVGHDQDRGRHRHELQDRGPEEPHRRQGRRQGADHLHARPGHQRGNTEVAGA